MRGARCEVLLDSTRERNAGLIRRPAPIHIPLGWCNTGSRVGPAQWPYRGECDSQWQRLVVLPKA